MKRGWLCWVFVLVVSVVAAQPTPLERVHRPFNEFLRKYVVIETIYEGGQERSQTRVRYGALKRDARWTSYTENLAKVDPVWLRHASPDDLMAFWVNTYNALVIATVVEHYPLPPSHDFPKPSIRAIPDAWQRLHKVAGRNVSLRDLENILDELGDGRVWFLVCPAAEGGPSLRPYAFTPSNITQELESACGAFCNDERHVKIDSSANQLMVSDYLQPRLTSLADPVRTYMSGTESYPPSEQALVDVILRRLPKEKREYIREKKPPVVFFPMDWGLNEAL